MVSFVLLKSFIFSRSFSSYFLFDGALQKGDVSYALAGSGFVKHTLAVLLSSGLWGGVFSFSQLRLACGPARRTNPALPLRHVAAKTA